MTPRARERYDVVVVGGGAGGTAAAVAAARSGARTLLIERYGFLGGAATNSQVLAYCGFYLSGEQPVQAVHGIGGELLGQLRQLGVATDPVRSRGGRWIVMLESEPLKLAFDRLVLASRVELSLHTLLVGATVSGNRIEALTLADHRGLREVEAASFVDASGEADLCARAGVPFTQPGGPGAQLQPGSLPVRLGGVPPDVEPDRARLAELVREHNARSPWKIERADGGVLLRLPQSRDFWWMAVDLVTDGISAADQTRAETAAREAAHASLGMIRQLPGFEHAYLLASGPQLGIRESRRPRSRGDMGADDGLAGRQRADGVGRAAWPLEIHEAPGRVRFMALGGAGFFDLAPSALRADAIDNLYLAGRVIGCDPQLYGSLRVMGTAFASGHAAGAAAALLAQGRQDDPGELRRVLAAQGALL
ncbi:FAD-dependent oxidoreductase [Ramlibacter tataouinensis]|uniref:FAD-dependent oxidoreductase n=1 Tax=Ramlibacter tataouinensis TaxID=94132 RepID=UPI0022F3AA8D|nr:FAD-dependent oxidoreductase [Ramlibacter tataouinensis]WBY02883.1 FAD-dependent oxidoreductase [Ramlibacter tataouinensis]